jgi:corrinoid protein of di/trimethylamine methyltransferase
VETEHIQNVKDAVIDGDQQAALEATRTALDAGLDPLIILREGLTQGANEVGEYFEEGTFFLPQLMMSGNALKAAMDIVLPAIKETHPGGGDHDTGVIVIATVQTDVHDIGKNLVSSMLSANGFTMHDLGVDVPLKTIIEQAEKVDADIIACSALLTTSMPYMRDLIQMLEARDLRERYRVMVGGAPVTPEIAKSIGADGTAADPMNAVKLAKRLINEKREAH